jgi:hypothetical protein
MASPRTAQRLDLVDMTIDKAALEYTSIALKDCTRLVSLRCVPR